MRNGGGPAYYIGIRPNGDYSVGIEPIGDYIGAGEKALLVIKGKDLDSLGELTFDLECSDAIGDKHVLQGVYKNRGKIEFREKNN